MEVGRVCMWGGLGKCYLPFLSLINVKNNGALVARQPHSTWFWFTAWGEGTACSKLVPPDEPPPSLTTCRRLLSSQHPSPHPQASHVKYSRKKTWKYFRISVMIIMQTKHILIDFGTIFELLAWESIRLLFSQEIHLWNGYLKSRWLLKHVSVYLRETATY